VFINALSLIELGHRLAKSHRQPAALAYGSVSGISRII
jgi:hypothetical protein